MEPAGVHLFGARALEVARDLDDAAILDGEVGLKRTLTGEPEKLNRNFNRRMKVVKTKLESGDPLQVGEVLRDLYPKWSDNSLSSSDQRIFEKCRDLLVSELALIRDVSYEDALEYLEETMSSATAS